MRTALDQCPTVTLASRNGLLYWTLSKLALLPACQRSNDQFSCSHVQILAHSDWYYVNLFAWSYQSWYSIFLSQQNSISQLINHRNDRDRANRCQSGMSYDLEALRQSGTRFLPQSFRSLIQRCICVTRLIRSVTSCSKVQNWYAKFLSKEQACKVLSISQAKS